jgi:hypothetical protein
VLPTLCQLTSSPSRVADFRCQISRSPTIHGPLSHRPVNRRSWDFPRYRYVPDDSWGLRRGCPPVEKAEMRYLWFSIENLNLSGGTPPMTSSVWTWVDCINPIAVHKLRHWILSNFNMCVAAIRQRQSFVKNYLSLICKINDFVHKFILDHKSVDFTIFFVDFTILYC